MHPDSIDGVFRARRRATVAILTMVMLVVIMGFAALTIDIGRLYVARGELQRYADAAALAGAFIYTTDAMLKVRLDASAADEISGVISSGAMLASTTSLENPTLGDPTALEATDLVFGKIDLANPTNPINTNPTASDYNVTQVVLRRSDSSGTNGSIPYYFAPVMGRLTGETAVLAAAAFDDRVSGIVMIDPGGGNIAPFSVHEDVFNGDLVGGSDAYSYDPDTDNVIASGDGIREVNIYPDDGAPGNFGLLNIGSPNQGVPVLASQIEDGVTPDDVEAEVGTAELVFFNTDGSVNTYDITGDPGMKSALTATLEGKVGQVIGFFLHNAVVENGANSVYTITNLRFGRLMGVVLTGNPADRGVWVQPVVYAGNDLRIDENAPSTNGLLGRLVLIR